MTQRLEELISRRNNLTLTELFELLHLSPQDVGDEIENRIIDLIDRAQKKTENSFDTLVRRIQKCELSNRETDKEIPNLSSQIHEM